MPEHVPKTMEDKKYFGGNTAKQLNWNRQLQDATMKPNNTLNLIRRNVGGCPRPVEEQCYKALLGPIMKYACAVWDPYTQANFYQLEMVQRRAARSVFQKYRRNANPSVFLTELGWETLAERRAKSKPILMYKIQNDSIDIPKKIFNQQISVFLVAK